MKCLVTVLLTVAYLLSLCDSARPQTIPSQEQPWSAALATARSPAQLGERLQSHLKDLPDDDLLELASDQSDTIALAAKWESLKRRGERMSTQTVAEFTGFLHGRTRAAPPRAWQVSLLQGYGDSDGARAPQGQPPKSHFDGQLDLSEARREFSFAQDQPTIIASNGEGFSLTESHAEFTFGERDKLQTTAPEVLKLFENGLSAPQRLAIARTDKAWFIALSDFAGSWGDLFCFEEDGTLRWKAKLWIHGQLIRAETGYHDYHVTIVPAGEMVVVYGFGSKTHAEGFDTATGDARFRFHPAYWNWHKTPAQFRK